MSSLARHPTHTRWRGPCWPAASATVTLLSRKRPTLCGALEAAFFDDGFLGRGVTFEHGVEALAVAIVRGSIDDALQVTVVYVRGSVELQ